MGEVISIREAYRVRRRRQNSLLNRRCKELIAEGITAWQIAYSEGIGPDRAICIERIRVLGELLAYADRLP
jgi:hypothetical protein